MADPFRIIPAKNSEVPILLSVPHCGTAFPVEIKDHYKPTLIQAPDDTDWFVDMLYDFVPYLGITCRIAVVVVFGINGKSRRGSGSCWRGRSG